ncbi:MAG: hypothetical protein KAS71_00750 [Bacteroidales bacterium]|nr:hypothetical protein [Bacteroidales bacterium]
MGKYALKKLQKSPTVTGLVGTDMKEYLVPVAVTMGGLVATQFTKNEYVKLGLVGAAGAGVEAMVKKATGKTILQGLEGVLGDEESYDETELMALNPVTQALPAADIDIEREIQASVSGAEDFSMSDEPIGSAASDYSMSDDPIGATNYPDDTNEEVGKINSIDPDSMDYDIFSGDMMES